MTDNRQFTDGTTIGGVDVYYEDKKLAESTSTTTITTEGVLLKGTDGAYYEIDKASLSEVIRAELGNILADNSKNNGTSVGKVPTLNSTGNAFGASSVADLASVLGDAKQSTTIMADTLKNTGVYACSKNNDPTLPFQYPTIIVWKRSSSTSHQLALDSDNSKIAYRVFTGETWTSWVEL